MILVDTTVWIDLFSGKGTPHIVKLESLIEDQEDLCTCGVIMTELMQGIHFLWNSLTLQNKIEQVNSQRMLTRVFSKYSARFKVHLCFKIQCWVSNL